MIQISWLVDWSIFEIMVDWSRFEYFFELTTKTYRLRDEFKVLRMATGLPPLQHLMDSDPISHPIGTPQTWGQLFCSIKKMFSNNPQSYIVIRFVLKTFRDGVFFSPKSWAFGTLFASGMSGCKSIKPPWFDDGWIMDGFFVKQFLDISAPSIENACWKKVRWKSILPKTSRKNSRTTLNC